MADVRSTSALTETGAFLGEPGSLRPLDEVGPGAALHRDGGVLWITTPDVAVAVYFGLAREFAKEEQPVPELIEQWFTAGTALIS